VPFTLIHAGKYRTADKSEIKTIQKLNTTPKSEQYKTQQNKTTVLVAFYDTQPGNGVGLFYNAPVPSAHASCNN